MPTITVERADLEKLAKSVRSLHARFDRLDRLQKAQHEMNKQFYINNSTLCSATPTAFIDANQPAQPHQDHRHQSRSQPPQGTKALQCPVTEANKRRCKQTILDLQPPCAATDTPMYTVLYLYRAYRMSHSQYRENLAAIGIDSTRILAVTFPARGISSILIPIDYKADILQILQDNNVPQALDFNPLDYKHIADSRFRAMSIPQLTCIAAAVHTDRCIRTVRYVKKHNVAGVLKFFLSQSWIPAATAHDLSLELLPASC